uniref:Cyanuric acid amidohydrolase n=1 Tax=Neobacillus citreus TaxID=2833578 RepID=A0A942Y8Z6_9BACI
MTSVTMLTVPTTGPGDTAALTALAAAGYGPSDVVSVIGKTEGNGCVNDFSRTLAATVWEPLLPEDAVTVFSGGTEGVLSPHVNLLVRDERPSGHDRGLVAAVGHTAPIPPQDLGRRGQVEAVAARVGELLDDLGVTADDAHLVLVKCPLLTSATMAQMRTEGHEPVTDDTYESMAWSRAASALGTAVALGECDLEAAVAALGGDGEIWSSRASASAGAELTDCHVLVLATSGSASNPLRAVHGAMRDAIDLATLTDLFAQVEQEGGEVVQVFAKAEADPTGTVRGLRHTMLTDSDLNSTRHARAAVGGLVAALRGSTDVYVSGGAEHQGPPGGGSVTVVYRVPEASA